MSKKDKDKDKDKRKKGEGKSARSAWMGDLRPSRSSRPAPPPEPERDEPTDPSAELEPAPETLAVNYQGPPAFDIQVRVREITRDAVKDNPLVTNGYWIRTFPLKKVCNLRLLALPGRGEYN